MIKIHNLETIIVDEIFFNYFYHRETNDRYGNPRYRVFLINPKTCMVTEKLANTYNIDDWVRSFIKNCQ